MILSGLYYQLDCNLRTTGLSVIVFIQLNYYQIYRSSNRRCFMKKGVLKDFTKFAGKQLYQSPFLITLRASVCIFIIKEDLAQMLSCEFCEFFKNTSRQLLLDLV